MNANEERERFKVVIGPEKYRVIPSGIYRARLIDVEDGIGTFNQDVFYLHFEITEEKYKKRIIRAIVNEDANGKRGQLWQLIKALGCVELDVCDSGNLLDLVGKECFINVEQRGKNNAITEYVSPKELDSIKRIDREA